MAVPSPPLQAAFAGLEQELAASWASRWPLPPELREYREAWRRTFPPGRGRRRGLGDLQTAAARAELLLAGDFHPLPRCRRRLARLLRDAPLPAPPLLLLELWPEREPCPAAEALERMPALLPGAPPPAGYRELLGALAAAGGRVAGPGLGEPGARRRDAGLVQAWEAWRGRGPVWILAGDWHLADAHLPRGLRAEGAWPLCLHQAPEPLWPGRGQRREEEILELGGGHWAWIHSSPLELHAAALAGGAAADPEEFEETLEGLAEDLAEGLARALGLPRPESRLAVLGPGAWEDFRALLAPADRSLLQAPPARPLVHPRLPLAWVPGRPSLAELTDAAAQVLALESGARASTAARRAFRLLCAGLLDPFFRPGRAEGLLRDLGVRRGPRPPRESRTGPPEALLAELRGRRLASRLAARGPLEARELLALLQAAARPSRRGQAA